IPAAFVASPPALNGKTLISANALPTGTVPLPLGNGISVTFTASYDGSANGFLPAGTIITNIVGNVITVSNLAIVVGAQTCTVPAAGGGNIQQPCSSNLPIAFTTGTSATLCPMIPFSSRGGASTDPNDGSLWLYGEFAKNRLSSIPGPGQWGTSVANYPLSFPAADTY